MRVGVDETGCDDAVGNVDRLVDSTVKRRADVDDRIAFVDDYTILQVAVLIVLGGDDVGSIDSGSGRHVVSLDAADAYSCCVMVREEGQVVVSARSLNGSQGAANKISRFRTGSLSVDVFRSIMVEQREDHDVVAARGHDFGAIRSQ